jgi:hypothetical protein
MKHLKASNTIEGYQTVTLAVKDLVSATVFETMPDYDRWLPTIKKGQVELPFLVYQTHPDYWTRQHLGLYRAGYPLLPTHAPVKKTELIIQNKKITTPRIHVIWTGRQQFQIAQESEYTDVDCVIETNFAKLVAQAQNIRNNKLKNVHLLSSHIS